MLVEMAVLGWAGLLIAVLVLLALPFKELVLYLIAVRSRRHYACPRCGEQIVMEHGTASVCSACGSPLQEQMRS